MECTCDCSWQLLFSHQVMSYSLQAHELQHIRLPWPSLFSGVCSNSCPLSWWCHPTVSSSVTPFFSCSQSFPTSGSFPVSWFFASGGQSIGASVLILNIQVWLPLGLTGLISLHSQGLSRVFPTLQFESINSLALRLLCWGGGLLHFFQGILANSSRYNGHLN